MGSSIGLLWGEQLLSLAIPTVEEKTACLRAVAIQRILTLIAAVIALVARPSPPPPNPIRYR
jgi:hypothetical protein